MPTKSLSCGNKPLSIDVWNEFSAKQKWDIMVALRGPDCHESRDGIKQFTSSAVRGKMIQVMEALKMRVGGQVNTDLGLMIVPDQRGGFLWNAQHFFEHQEEAGSYLGIPLLKIPKDVYLHHMGAMFSTSGYTETLVSLHDAVVDTNAVVAYYKKGLRVLRAFCANLGLITKEGKWEKTGEPIEVNQLPQLTPGKWKSAGISGGTSAQLDVPPQSGLWPGLTGASVLTPDQTEKAAGE